MEIQGLGKPRHKVILVPFPFHSRGFSIVVAHTKYNAPNPLSHPEFIFHGLWDGLGAGYDMSFDRILGAIYVMNENCRGPLQDYLKKNISGGEEIACVVYDRTMFFVDDVATNLNIPSIVLATFSAAYLQACVPILPWIDTTFPLQGIVVHTRS